MCMSTCKLVLLSKKSVIILSMREAFSIPDEYSKKQAKREIEEGLSEHVRSPRSKEGIHPELAESFIVAKAEQPLTRLEFEKDVEDYVAENFEQLLPVFLSTEQNHAELIKRLGITNKDIGILGANYYIFEQDGKPAIFQTDEKYPEGTQLSEYENARQLSDYEISPSDLLALSYAKDALRIDSRKSAGGGSGSTFPHRYYFRAKDRYLCANDFGMRVWSEKKNELIEGDVTNANALIQTVKKRFEDIQANIQTVNGAEHRRMYDELVNSAKKEKGLESLSGENSQLIGKQALELATQNFTRKLAENPKDKELLITAVPAGKVKNQLHFKYEKIAKQYGLIGENPQEDYEKFEQNAKSVEQLLREPSVEEKAGTSLDFFYSDLYNRPVIDTGGFNRASVIRDAKSGVHDILARKAIDTMEPAQKEIFTKYLCGRGEGSPYFYPTNQIFDFIKLVGVEKASQVLNKDDRNISEQMTGFALLKAMHFDITKLEPDQLKKQLHQAETLDRSGLLRYLEERNKNQIESARAKFGKKAEDKNWLELVGVRKSRDLFYEGKRMHWLAKQVWSQSPNRTPEDRFYRHDSNVNWDRYDLSKADVPEEKLKEYLEKHKNLIVALLGQGADEQPTYGEQKQEKGTAATLGLIIQALERGQDLRGIAVANDKQRYLEGVIKGGVENDLEFAVADWPAEWRKAVSPEEISLYYEYASDYVLLDPNGLAKYATWRASDEGKQWAELFTKIPERKSELDFRICLSHQTEEIRGWYKGAAEHVGNDVMQSYLLRFNATRGTDGRIANWHDVLLWSPNVRKLESVDARSILGGIETMDDNQEFVNLLPRYSKERDPLKELGPVQSLRELKKRVLGIESNIDMSKFPPELLEITSAPGFNLAALESMRQRADFQDLFEGKLDKEQPFSPRSRTFAGRALTEALREGLGSQKQKIRGTASDPKGLFYTLNQLVKGREEDGKKLQVTDLLNSVPTDLEEEIIRLLREQKVDVGPIVEAQVHAKSDPEGWVCGNYTDCCMPFGDSKNDDYMFNPSTQYFTIKYNGRTVAQSVVVDSKDERDQKDVVVLDNIEVANNYKNLSPLLAKVYQTFWTEYTSKPVKVGTGYSDLIPPGGKLESNSYRAKTRLSWSDATGSNIYDLPKIRGVESLDKIVTFANISERDADLIAKMEAEAYPPGMTQGKAHIADVLRKQRELEVPGAASSFIIRQGEEAAGYLLVLPEESETSPGEQAAHVYDMVVLPKFRGSPLARKMMERVLDVATAYKVPIEAEARASTSYPLLMNKRIRSWFESKGFYLTRNEKLPAYLGGEDFYSVRFENRQGAEVTV